MHAVINVGHKFKIYLLILLCAIMSGSDSAVVDGKEQNWAVIPYDNTKNALFPTFSDKSRKFKFDGISEEIVIEQNWDEQGVSAVVWEAAVDLAKYIASTKNVEGKRILELGAGTGLVGIACAKLGAKVTMTDLKEALPSLSKNVDTNFNISDINTPEVHELNWGQNLQHYNPWDYDIIIGADIVYIEDTFNDLLDTICYLAKCPTHDSIIHNHSQAMNNSTLTHSLVILSAKMRYSREAKFMNRMKKFFNVKLQRINGANIHIYEASPLI